MTADLIERVRSRGAGLRPLGGRLRVFHPERLDPATIAMHCGAVSRAVLRGSFRRACGGCNRLRLRRSRFSAIFSVVWRMEAKKKPYIRRKLT